jgi:lipopolysaccharide transport system ATP-binding protein
MQSSQDDVIWALKDVSFEVKQGEVVGIIGRNGAGKSTLLKILTRITEPTSGSVKLYGRVSSLLEVGTGFHPELTGRENIYLNGAILGMRKAEINRKFDEIVEFAEIEKFLDTPVKRYSSGMYVRLAFAVAAHLEPEILLVDEVLAVGDAQFQKKCLGKMGDVSKEGRTVLFVSHNMAAISTLCSRVLLFDHGEITGIGSPQRVISDYLSQGTVKPASVVDLTNHPGRTKHREIALLSVWIENRHGIKGGLVKMGEPVSLCAYFKSSKSIAVPGFGFSIEDIEGRRIFSFTNHMLPNSDIPRSVKNGVMTCHIPKLPLLAGTYYVTLSLTESKKEYVDRVERAFSFSVEVDDIYGSGVIPERSQGTIFTDAKVTFM